MQRTKQRMRSWTRSFRWKTRAWRESPGWGSCRCPAGLELADRWFDLRAGVVFECHLFLRTTGDERLDRVVGMRPELDPFARSSKRHKSRYTVSRLGTTAPARCTKSRICRERFEPKHARLTDDVRVEQHSQPRFHRVDYPPIFLETTEAATKLVVDPFATAEHADVRQSCPVRVASLAASWIRLGSARRCADHDRARRRARRSATIRRGEAMLDSAMPPLLDTSRTVPAILVPTEPQRPKPT